MSNLTVIIDVKVYRAKCLQGVFGIFVQEAKLVKHIFVSNKFSIIFASTENSSKLSSVILFTSKNLCRYIHIYLF